MWTRKVAGQGEMEYGKAVEHTELGGGKVVDDLLDGRDRSIPGQ